MWRELSPALFLLLLGAGYSAADGNVGCLFSPVLCVDQVEWCYDDHAFGKCLKIYEEASQEDLLRHELTGSELRAFERELQRLLLLGYRWSHLYTQCVLQAMLHAINNKLQYEPSVCDNLSDQDMHAGPITNQVNPEEMAIIRFTPNSFSNPDAESNFASEVYYPPSNDLSLPPEEQQLPYEEENIPPEYDAWQEMVKDLYQRKHKRSKEGHVFSRLYNTPGDFRKGRETKDLSIEDLQEFFNNEYINNDNTPSQTNGYLTSADILYLLQPENEEELRAFVSQLTYPSRDNYDNYNRDPLNKWLANQDLDQLKSTLEEIKMPYTENVNPYYLATSEFLTKNKLGTDRFSHQYNTPDSFRQGFETKDIVLDEKQDNDGEMVEPRIYVDEGEESREDAGSGEQDNVDRLRELEYLENSQMPARDMYNEVVARQMEDTALMSKLLNIWRSGQSNRQAPVYTEGGMVYLPTPTDSESEKSQLLDRSLGEFLADYELGFKRKERLDVKKPGPPFDTHNVHFNHNSDTSSSAPEDAPQVVKKDDTEGAPQDIRSHDSYDVDISYAYIGVKDSIWKWDRGLEIVEEIRKLLELPPKTLSHVRVDMNEVSFKVEDNPKGYNASDVAMRIDGIKDELKKRLGVDITKAGVGNKAKNPSILMDNLRGDWMDWEWSETSTMWAGLVAGVLAAGVAATALFLLARHHQRRREKLRDLTNQAGDTEASQDYRELCRARMSGKWQPAGGGGVLGEKEPGQRIASLSKDSDGNSPSTRSSTSSWSEEPALTNMDISTGHMVLTYMEDHLKNKDRLEQEWRALCAYEAEPCATLAAEAKENVAKNRTPGVLPYDHSRIVLNDITNLNNSDYINASTITDHDPRNPAYIAAQGPLPDTIADWWQMVWEQGSVVLVMLTRLSEGSTLCQRYWPEEGSQLYHIYEVHLVSEHIWCDDYLVRSFYLKNLKTGETRTVTQFHFLSWPDRGVPSSTKALLEFRRKVNKSYRGRSCPIVVHCSDGAGRTGTYCLIDMVLNRMAKGAKEIDIAATLEHIRDQRPHMVTTKQQFEFVLMAVAEEVHAILKALPAQLQQQHDKREKELAGQTDKEKQDKDKDKDK